MSSEHTCMRAFRAAFEFLRRAWGNPYGFLIVVPGGEGGVKGHVMSWNGEIV